MKTQNRTPHPLAILTSQVNGSPLNQANRSDSLAVLFSVTDELFAVSQTNSESNQDWQGWQHLLPAGEFSSPDGRPADVASGKWQVDEATALMLIAQVSSKPRDIVVDYEHQTLLKDTNGQPAPAAGFFNGNSIKWISGKGLYIKPTWTEKAAAFIAAKEYRYLSAVFSYDKATGKPTQLHHAALTNNPGLDVVDPVSLTQSLKLNQPTHQTEGNTVDKLQIIKMLGLPDNASDAEITAGLAAMKESNVSLTAELKASKESVVSLTAQVAGAATGASGGADPAQFVPIATYDAAMAQVAALTAQTGQATVAATVDKALQDGRAYEHERLWLMEVGAQSTAALTTILDKRAPVAALSGLQTQTVAAAVPPENKDDSVAALTADEQNAAKALGLSHAEFTANKTKAGS